MSELLTNTTDQDKHESAFITDTETNEREINVENVEAKQQLAVNILKLVESDDPKATGDYFTEVLDNKIKTSDAERCAIFDFLANQQKLAMYDNISKKQDLVIEKLDIQAKQSQYIVSDLADNLLRTVNNINQDVEKNIDSKLRQGNDIDFAIRGYEPLPANIESAANVLDLFTEKLVATNCSKLETIQDYSLDFKKGSDKKHLEALDEVSRKDKDSLELSVFIDQDVISKAVEKLQDAIAESKKSGESPQDALLDMLNERPSESLAEKIESVNNFIKKIENSSDINSGDLAIINIEASRIRSALESMNKKALNLTEERRIDPDWARNINRSFHVELSEVSQLSFNMRKELDRHFAEESNLQHKDEISTPQTSKASSFR